MRLQLNEHEWQECGAPGAAQTRLLYDEPLYINGTAHHVEAYQVEDDEAGCQRLVETEWSGKFQQAFDLLDDARLQTITIHGLRYVVLVQPHGA